MYLFNPQNAMMAELKTRVDELKMENEYQLRLKDMNYNEKIKELTEKFIQEMESLKTKNQVWVIYLFDRFIDLKPEHLQIHLCISFAS